MKHVSKYVPADELESYREATENCRLFMESVATARRKLEQEGDTDI